jgi:tetrahedral aminopeptidase
MKQLIQKLVETTGPSGYESAVRELVRAEINGHADEIRVDAMGNLMARKGKKLDGGADSGSMRIMISAHMDEIGLICSHVDEKGFLRFVNIGGVRPLNCVGGRVQFLNGARGVIFLEPQENGNAAPTLDKLYIDVGATSRSDCPVKVGDMGVFDRPFLDLGNRLVSKAMDDRISVAVAIEALRQLKETPHEIYFVFSVQEEVGCRGAITAAFGVEPDLGIAIDVTLTGDTPKARTMEVSLGSGPAIKVRDGGMLSDPRLVQRMVEAAQAAGLPYQLEVLEAGTTDASVIQISRTGVPVGCISIPCRYVHSPSEMVDFNDVQNAVKLLVELLSKAVLLK